MSRTFTDDDLLVWEAYPTGGDHGYAERPYVVFNCLTNRLIRPRYVQHDGDEADAERTIAHASADDLNAMLKRSRELS